jgi:hypothetical protein
VEIDTSDTLISSKTEFWSSGRCAGEGQSYNSVMKAGEDWARLILQQKLRRVVVPNDDGGAPGIYDLRIGPPDAPEVAIECIGALDS